MSCIYNKNLVLQIVNPSGSVEDKTLNLIIINSVEALQIKVREPSEYTFNYTETIDLGDYEIMRSKQNLDINFSEFVSNLLEMLQQVQKKEMFLRCEASEKLCTLIFYNKSKIKSITYLTVDLHASSQKEILNEVMNNMHYIKESNERLQLQISNMKTIISNKEKEIKHLNFHKTEMESQFFGILKELERNINMKSKEVEHLLLRKIKFVSQRIGSLLEEINVLKRETAAKTDSSSRLLRNIENLRLENTKTIKSIDQVKVENSELQTAKVNLEKRLADLTYLLNEKNTENADLQSKNEELRIDMEKATVIIAQKKSALSEISKDLVQANQMLVSLNNHYDKKFKECESLQSTLNNKEHIIQEEKRRNYELQKEFDGYRLAFNSETQEKLKHDLFKAQSKVEELEQSMRKANKINALLSEKVNRIGF